MDFKLVQSFYFGKYCRGQFGVTLVALQYGGSKEFILLLKVLGLTIAFSRNLLLQSYQSFEFIKRNPENVSYGLTYCV